MLANNQDSPRKLYSVSQLNRLSKQLLEDAIPRLWVEGEISNVSTPSSGHVYFSLKDQGAQIRCAMFRQQHRQVNFKLINGMAVHAFGQVSLYEGRGDYQLILDKIEEVGDGKLQQRFEALKKQLHAEGLFANEIKRPLPAFPKTIGVISSTTGAALRDVLSVHQRRFPAIPIIIYPTMVQGTEATAKIIQAIDLANRHQAVDVLLLIRGGGSLEDLWCFNEEGVARAIHQSTIPIVSGIGHEIDFTIADFVADHRAPTPSAAAELVTPDRQEIKQTLQQFHHRLVQRITTKLAQHQQQLMHYRKRLTHPGTRLRELAQTIDHLEQKMHGAMGLSNLKKHQQLRELSHRLQHSSPKNTIKELKQTLAYLSNQLQLQIQQTLHNKKQQLANVARALDGVSPLNTLSRGFAIATLNDRVITQAQQVKEGDQVDIRLHEGKLNCKVERIES